MLTLLRREFTVDLPLETTWQHLARVEEWPSWAKPIRKVDGEPPGALGPGSTGHSGPSHCLVGPGDEREPGVVMPNQPLDRNSAT